MNDDKAATARVGALVLVALAMAAASIYLIGQESDLFTRKVDYYSVFPTVSGINQGNPVQLDGVKVGTIGRVVLPENVGASGIRVEFSVDRRYRERVRGDSEAKIQTIGLLGDKYIEIRSGTAARPPISEGGEVPAARGGAVEALMQSGEDVMTNISQISESLRSILARLDRGEGLLGELLSDQQTGEKVSDKLVSTLDSLKTVANRIEQGEGTIPRLITDRALADRLEGTVGRLDTLLARYEQAQGLLPALMTETEPRQQVERTLGSLEQAAADLSAFAKEAREGQGLIQKLLTDEAWGDQTADQLSTLLARLDRLTTELESGDGTAAKLIHDPQLYQALKDIVTGVNESRTLRWLIRNRQKAGEEKRLEDAAGAQP
jgi:phospholipid/cholesterol/gamma-HCH transport system substrate-binding protein